MIVAESFLPHMNGVTNSVLRTIDYLLNHHHEVQVIAPHFKGEHFREHLANGVEVLRLPAMSLPQYPEIRLAIGARYKLMTLMQEFDPDVVHLASPFVLGARAASAAGQLAIPTVAIYQTNVPAYMESYGVPELVHLMEQHVVSLHSKADLTLAPSSETIFDLQRLGVPRLRLWRRGVDMALFNPVRRSVVRREILAPNGGHIIGYVGRFAEEKQVADLAALNDIPNSTLVLVGDGPMRAQLEALLPEAVFTGFLNGVDLAETVASFDVFVHTGERETFCQTIQEAMASGVPVVTVAAGGPLDLVEEGYNGLFYQPGELDEFRAQVEVILSDTPERGVFARNAYESVQDRSWDSICEQLVDYYHEAIIRKSPWLHHSPERSRP